MNISFVPAAGLVKHVNSDSTICDICGSPYDEDGFCAHGHQRGQTYYAPPKESASVKAEATEDVPPGHIKCEPDGVRCNICGGFIEEGDDICQKGHQIGKIYPMDI